MKNKFFDTVRIVFLALLLALGTSYALADWDNAPGNPPDCPNSIEGCNTPVNISGVDQVKDGGLSVGSLSVDGGAMILGGVTSSVPTPIFELALRALGRIGATEYCDRDGTSCYPISALVGGDGGPGDPPGNTTWTQVGNNQYSSLSGNVGIGQSNPTSKLDVYTESNDATALRVRNWGTGSNTYGVHISTGGTGGAGTALYVAGNAVGGGKAIVVPSTGGPVEINSSLCLGSSSNPANCKSTWGSSSGDNLGNHIATDNIELNGKWLSNDGDDEGIQVSNAGNVRIGPEISSTNNFKLEVNGDIQTNGSLRLEGTGSLFLPTGAGIGKVLTSNGPGLAAWENNLADHGANENIRLSTYYLSGDGGDEGMKISGTGVATFSNDVDIVGTGGEKGDLFVEEDLTVGRDFVLANGFNLNGELRPDSVTCGNNQTIRKTGANDWDCVTWPSSSSGRWKENVKTLTGALDSVLNLRGVSYTWDKEHGGKQDIGLIAEEVGKIVPEAVEWETNGKDARGVEYGHLVGLLVEAIKDQQQQIEDLKAKVNSLEN